MDVHMRDNEPLCTVSIGSADSFLRDAINRESPATRPRRPNCCIVPRVRVESPAPRVFAVNSIPIVGQIHVGDIMTARARARAFRQFVRITERLRGGASGASHLPATIVSALVHDYVSSTLFRFVIFVFRPTVACQLCPQRPPSSPDIVCFHARHSSPCYSFFFAIYQNDDPGFQVIFSDR